MGFLKISAIIAIIFSYIMMKLISNGSRLTYLCSIFNYGCTDPSHFTLTADSYYDPRFERAVNQFINNFKKGHDIGSTFTVYYKGEKVVDVACGYKDEKLTKPYGRRNLQLVYSTSKSLCTIAIALLVDRGVLKYSDKISKHWPEFTQGNKENVTISELVQHKSGLHFFTSGKQLTLEELKDLDGLSKILEKEPHIFGGEPKLAYHFQSLGHWINEIVRRVDPKHRSLHYFIQDEIAKPLNIDFKFLLTKKEFEEDFVPTFAFPKLQLYSYSYPKLVIYQPIRKLLGYNQTLSSLRHYINPDTEFYKANNIYDKNYVVDHANEYNTYTAEMPGFNMVTNAASLGKLAGLLAHGGELNGTRLLKKETIELMTQYDKTISDYDELLECHYIKPYGGLGYHDNSIYSILRGDANYIGWGGFGGSFFGFNMELNFGMSYVPNALGDPAQGIDHRGLKLVSTVYEIIDYEAAKERLYDTGREILKDLITEGLGGGSSDTVAETETENVDEL